ncbi:MAG: hypothetical protein CMJ59_08740 [Planctomycetaceae bacterium]|nr:hypothetical protein [Planctomycetaceae bacterium]
MLTRRAMLRRSALGFGSLALSALQRGEDLSAQLLPMEKRRQLHHFAPRAKSVIMLLQSGGVSQMDVLDPKPELTRRHGQTYSLKLEVQQMGSESNTLLATHKKFQPRGQCGMEISDVLPNLGALADDLCLVRSMFTEHNNHSEAQVMLMTGKIFEGRPAIGSWISYGLGRANQNLPAYVVLREPGGEIPKTLWSSGWMPAVHRGTEFSSEGVPILNLRAARDQPDGVQSNKLDFLAKLNRLHQRRYPEDQRLESRIQNYELAARMQLEALEVAVQKEESAHVQRLYGLDNPTTQSYGRSCLLARKLVERGVRFVQVMSPAELTWDTHPNFDRAEKISAATDLPAAGLIRDLKQRGMLESTLVLWSGEFGRLPISQSSRGRDHNRHACSLLLAGGGFKSGHVHGATDEVGYKAVVDRVSVPDLHATVLHQLGIDHDQLTYRHAGRDETLTDSAVTNAQVVRSILT